ncbi:MAG: sensor histidine kinase [Chitinophagaceae bacterium]|nr:sensor histidine kinase [Chitinophagaceae bacterium]MCW5929529.1 sensor histidine kinase [Chitinophagaceae bacterium]
MLRRAILFLPFLLCALLQTQAQSLSTDSLVNELKTAKDDTTRVNLYRMLAGILLNSDPATALGYAKAGVDLGIQAGFDKGVAGCYLNMSVVYNAASKIDSFLIFTDSAIVWSKKVGEPNRLALAYLNRADACMQLRNLKQSLLDCDTALHYAELANNNDRRARINQTIGTIYYYQDKYSESKSYYDRAYRLYEEGGNKKMQAIMLNNLANIYKRTGAHDSSLNYYKQAIAVADQAGDEVNISMYYSNISSLYNFTKQYKKAESAAALALQHARDNEVQQADAYANYAESFLQQHKITDAIEAGLKAYGINSRYAFLEEQIAAAKILAEAYTADGNYKEANFYLKKSSLLNDTLLKNKFDEQIAYMQTSFKVEEKNNEIALLTRDKQIQEQNLSKQRILIAGSLLLALLAVVAIFLLINRQRLKQRMKELQLRNEIASDLHDEVGSSLSSIHMLSEMASSEKSDMPQQKDILKKVSAYSRETMEKMGDIVWMIKHSRPEDKSLEERMKHFFYDICKSKNIEPSFRAEEAVLHKLDMPQRKALYLVFKEAVNNAVKYSAATEIKVSIEQTDRQMLMQITDNGSGFDDRMQKKGNGLKNMQNRATELKGSTTIHSVAEEGTTVTMSIPL